MTNNGLLSIAERATYTSSRGSDWLDEETFGGRVELPLLKADLSTLRGTGSSIMLMA